MDPSFGKSELRPVTDLKQKGSVASEFTGGMREQSRVWSGFCTLAIANLHTIFFFELEHN